MLLVAVFISLQTVSQFIETGRYKKIILVGSDKMSSITDYSNRTTCPLFGDAAVALMLEPVKEDVGIIDHIFHVDGSGRHYLYMKGGGSQRPSSHETVDTGEHYVFSRKVKLFLKLLFPKWLIGCRMMEKHNITPDDLHGLVPHQAKYAYYRSNCPEMGLPKEKVMINIEKYGNTTAATIPLCLWDWEKQLKKGDNIIMAAFGGGYTWGSLYLKWAYDLNMCCLLCPDP